LHSKFPFISEHDKRKSNMLLGMPVNILVHVYVQSEEMSFRKCQLSTHSSNYAACTPIQQGVY